MIACVNGHELVCIKGLAFDYESQLCKPASDLKCVTKPTTLTTTVTTTTTKTTVSTTKTTDSTKINIKSAALTADEASDENLKCTSEQRISPHPNDCSKFLLCEKMGNGSLVEVESSCPGGLFFNSVLKVCDWPQNVNCKSGNKKSDSSKLVTTEISKVEKTEFICLKNGLFPHPLFCSVYYGLFSYK